MICPQVAKQLRTLHKTIFAIRDFCGYRNVRNQNCAYSNFLLPGKDSKEGNNLVLTRKLGSFKALLIVAIPLPFAGSCSATINLQNSFTRSFKGWRNIVGRVI